MTVIEDPGSCVDQPAAPPARGRVELTAAPPADSSADFTVPPPALADPSGRRARVLKRAGLTLAVVLSLWLIGLALAGLGVVPAGDVPLARSLVGASDPPARHAVTRDPRASRSLPGVGVDPNDGSTAGRHTGRVAHQAHGTGAVASKPSKPSAGGAGASSGASPTNAPAGTGASSATSTPAGTGHVLSRGSQAAGRSGTSAGKTARSVTRQVKSAVHRTGSVVRHTKLRKTAKSVAGTPIPTP